MREIQGLRDSIQDVPDFPKAGILFRDIGPLLGAPGLFREVIDVFAEEVARVQGEVIVGIESRGFLFGPAVSYVTGCPFVPVRKRGKLPGAVVSVEYALEYGTDVLEIQEGSIAPGARCVVIDDVLATGGTARAARELVRQAHGEVIAAVFLIELGGLRGRTVLGIDTVSSALRL